MRRPFGFLITPAIPSCCSAVEPLEARKLFSGFQADINFQPASVPVPAGYDADSGAAFGDRGNGLTYGWNVRRLAAVYQVKSALRAGGAVTQDTFATINHTGPGSVWEIAVPDGTYSVDVVVGSPTLAHAFYSIEAEGVSVLSGKATPSQHWIEGDATVTVSDGLLSLSAGPKASGTRIDLVDITQLLPSTGTTQAPSPASPASPPAPPSPPPPPIPSASSPSSPVSPPAPVPPPASPPAPPVPPVPPPPPLVVSAPSPPAPLTWQQVASAPVAMAEGQDATIDGKVYVFGGYSVTDPSWQANSQLNVYDPATNTWTALASVPESLSEAAVATDGVDLYVAGGYITNANGQQTFGTTDVWKYDPASNAWSPFVSLPQARAVGAMVYLDGQLQYFGGSNLSRVDCTDHWVLNLDSSNPQWTASTPLPVAVNRLGGVVLNGDIYAVGGQSGYDNYGIPTSAVYMWNPQNPGSWTAVASMPEPHSHIGAATAVVDGMIIVAGGDEAVGDFLDNVIAYNPTTNSWTELTPLPSPRFAPIVAAIGNQVLVTDGYDDGTMSSTTWESDPLQT